MHHQILPILQNPFTQNSVFCAKGIKVQFIVDMNTFYTQIPNNLYQRGSVLGIPDSFKMTHLFQIRIKALEFSRANYFSEKGY